VESRKWKVESGKNNTKGIQLKNPIADGFMHLSLFLLIATLSYYKMTKGFDCETLLEAWFSRLWIKENRKNSLWL